MDIFLFIECWDVGHYGYGESGVDCEVLIFPVYFHFDFVLVVFVRLYSVDLRYLSNFFGFTFFFFVAVDFLGVVYPFPVCRVLLRHTLAKCPSLWQLLHSAVFAGHLCDGVQVFVRKIHNRFSFVLVSRYICFCLVGIFCVFFVLVPVLFLSL